MIIMIMGLPGTGKSSLGQRVALDLGAIYLSSDQIRDMLGLRGQYAYRDKEAVYQEMLNRLGPLMEHGHIVVLDATFSQKKYRIPFVELAAWQQVPIYIIELIARPDTIAQRVKEKRCYSEADFEVYQRMLQGYEAPSVPTLQIRTDQLSLAQQANLVLALRDATPPASPSFSHKSDNDFSP